MYRDRDIRSAIRDTLKATGAFDDVYLSAEDSQSSEERLIAVIRPRTISESTAYDPDSTATISRLIDSTCTITFFARDDDAQIRDEAVERLVMVAALALDRQSFAGQAMPQWTGFTDHAWAKATPPEQKVTSVFKYRYNVDSTFGTDS